MSESDKFFQRANDLLDRLEQLLPSELRESDIKNLSSSLLCWKQRDGHGQLAEIRQSSEIRLSDLQNIERQKKLITQNTEQFLKKLPANNVLLWGPRGTGKSSLIKAILNEYQGQGLRLIQVEREHLVYLPDICEQIFDVPDRFIIFCDDLSFDKDDPSYKTLKVILDGSVNHTPENVLIYATSNRRHLMPEYMSENQQSQMIDGELHLHEGIEEKLSLSERFGLWLSFHPFNQEQYLTIVNHWLHKLNAPKADEEEIRKTALKWALEHGSRSGRSAWQFARDWTGRKKLEQQ